MASMKGLNLAQKITFQWKRGWNEIPEVMASTGFFIVGFVGLSYMLYDFQMKENKTKKFKHEVIIYRPDDPRAALLHRDHRSPVFTKTPQCSK